MIAKKGKYGNVAAWCSIGGREYYFRSKWERNFAHYLEWQRNQATIWKWDHEPQCYTWTNRLGNKVTYKPDFIAYYAYDREHTIIIYEVKGYMDARSKSKLEGFKKHFPEENLVVIDKKWFAKQNKILKGLVPGWQ